MGPTFTTPTTSITTSITTSVTSSPTPPHQIGAFKAALETSALELKPKEVQALMACVDSEDGVTFAYVPLCEYAFRILEHLYREEAYHLQPSRRYVRFTPPPPAVLAYFPRAL